MTKGFTLVEVLMVMLITVILTTVLVANFSRSRISISQAALLVQDAVREAQTLALSGALWQGRYRCGFGIHFAQEGYTVFAGPPVSDDGCSTDDFTFDADGVSEVRNAPMPDATLEFASVPPDIYFVPPNPTVYMDGAVADAPTRLTVRKKGTQACVPADCKTIIVSPAGLVTLETPQPQRQ